MKRKLSIALDVDEVLAVCIEYAIQRWNAESGANLSIYDIDGWGTGNDGWTKYFKDESFVLNQPVVPGAQTFVQELIRRGCDVLIITAVPPNVANARVQWIRTHFPEIKPDNIIIGKRKDICVTDVLIDDAAHNILHSQASFPILMRKPWNKEVTGCLAANDFNDCLHLIDSISRQRGFNASMVPTEVVCLVGPSGSGKHKIIAKLIEEGYTVPCIYTTNPAAKQSYYKVVTQSQFEQGMRHFTETTSYAGFYYGTRTKDWVRLMSENKCKIVIPIDVCGANALQRMYGERVKTVYIKRNRSELVYNILQKPLSDKEKTLRIGALDAEEKNEYLCDYSIPFTTLDEIVNKIKEI